MGNELQQIIGAVTPGTEVLLYMRAEAQKEPELQIVVRRGLCSGRNDAGDSQS